MRYYIYSLIVVFLFVGCGQDYYDLDFDKNNDKTKKDTKNKKTKKYKIDETIDNRKIQNDENNNEKPNTPNELLDEKLLKKPMYNPSFNNSSTNKIALLYSSKTIGKFAINATNSVLGYLLSQNQPFELKVFDIASQSTSSIASALQKAQTFGHKNIVAILTNSSYNNLINYNDIDDFSIYLPLINKKNTINRKDNIIYGGLDYEKQLELLSRKTQKKSIEYYSFNTIGKILHKNTTKIDPKVKYSQSIQRNQKSFNSLIGKKKWLIDDSSVYLNTSLVTSSIILSTIKAKQIKPANILSTQINFSPVLLSMTGANALKGLTIANSIRPIDQASTENIALLGGDIRYNWISYSTIVGVDIFLDQNKKIEPNIIDGQVDFDVRLFKAVNGSLIQNKF